MKKKNKLILGIVAISIALTLLVNFPFGFYTWLDQPIDDVVYGVNFFGYYIIGPTGVLDVSYILGAFVLNFGLLYGVFFLVGSWRKHR